MGPHKYVHRQDPSIVIEAWQHLPGDSKELAKWCLGWGHGQGHSDKITIPGLRDYVSIGDYVIKEQNGNFNVVWGPFFCRIYEPIDPPKPINPTSEPDLSGLEEELRVLLNKNSCEKDSDTPDFILAEYLISCLHSFNLAVQHRSAWYGDHGKPM